MKYQTYPAYKDSGVEWLGKLPEHWNVCAIKHIVSIPITDGPHETPNFFDSGIPFVSAEAISTGRIDFEKIRAYISEEDNEKYSKKYFPKKYDIYMVKSGATTGITAIVETDIKFNIWSPLAVIRCNEKSNPYFVLNFLRSFNFKEAIELNWSFGTQQNIGMGVIENLHIAKPPFQEQQKIAQFLDHETAKIDTLIEKQQRLIELLKEKRQAVISHAVTKGLNPNAPMKDSGVEWLGELPEHWEVTTVAKSSNKITNGYVGQTKDILVDEGVSYVQAIHIKKGKVNFDGAYFVRQNWSNAHSKSILAKGDVLIVQTGAGTGDIGLVTEKEEGFNCHALIIVELVKTIISGDFLSMVLQSQYGYSKLYSIRTGGMHPHLNCGEVQFVKLPIPPRDEQDEIINYIERNVTTFDLLINKQLDVIELMQERRTVLISAAVTGKIDVREWDAPNA
jgi:type I restriction enzyme S subunit